MYDSAESDAASPEADQAGDNDDVIDAEFEKKSDDPQPETDTPDDEEPSAEAKSDD